MKRVLPVIVISQFFCTSLWFAGNAIMTDISRQLHLPPVYMAYLASAVQAGFIIGTLIFAIFNIPDRFSSTKVFFVSAVTAAVINLLMNYNGINSNVLIFFRFMMGFFIAGIYPVGMKIAADHYQQGLGKSLGFLLGALVIGTALPHFLKSAMATLPYRYVIFSTSFLSVLGGSAMYLLVPEGPYRKPAQKLNFKGFTQSFRNKNFRAAAFGYFGHMWELYTFWVFLPFILTAYNAHNPGINLNVPLFSFFIIVSGSVSCVFAGLISQRVGAKKVATIALSVSCACCIISPLLFFSGSLVAFITFLFIWGMAIIADSPMFSTLIAQNAPPESKGTALTIVNCIGFTITIVSIQLVNLLRYDGNAQFIYMLLAIGPILGLIALFRNKTVAV